MMDNSCETLPDATCRRALRRRLLAWYDAHARDAALAAKPRSVRRLAERNHAPADAGGNGQGVLRAIS